MELSDVGASLRRHWTVAILLLLLIPAIMAGYLINRDVVRPPARYTTSADVLIPARDSKTGEPPAGVPPVLLQGQEELALGKATRDVALKSAGINPIRATGIAFSANLNDGSSIMTLAVSAPVPETASLVLDEYIVAYEDARRQSVLDAAIDLQEIEARVIGVLTREISDVEAELQGRGVPLPPRVPDGDPVAAAPGTSNESILLLYERNALLNEIQRRQVNYSLATTEGKIPAAFTTVVQRRSTARITPPPPSPLVPLAGIAVGGLLLALAVPVVLDRLNSTITEARTAPRALRANLLQQVPYLPRRLHHEYAPVGSQWDLAFRSLAATSISTDRLPKAIMVTTPVGATQDAVAANFAASLARLGVSVVLIGTVARQRWFLRDGVDADVYVDVDAAERRDGEEAVREVQAVQTEASATGEAERPTWAMPPVPPTVPGATPEVVIAAAGAPSATVPVPGQPDGLVPVASLPELLIDAQAGRLNGGLKARLGTRDDIDNLYVIPPGGEGEDLVLDGLPPLLDVIARNDIDIAVIAGPALLTEPTATIMAWSTRHVMWALELGRVNTKDAQLAADRLDLAGVEPFGIALVNRRS